MKIADETLQLLDEHQMTTQQLGFSPFKAAFELRIQEWEDKLKLTQKVVDEWIECQKLVFCFIALSSIIIRMI